MKEWVVTQIVDHHIDEHVHLDTTTTTCTTTTSNSSRSTKQHPNRRIIAFNEQTQKATVASTCTLVVERLQELIATTNLTTNRIIVPPSLSILLLGVI